MNLNQWAIKWGVPAAALQDLQNEFGMVNTDPVADDAGESETAIQTRIRLEGSRKGLRLWRNNLGAVHTSEGTFIRFGLCNDSKAMNKELKSSDLIGIRPLVITAAHYGTTVGQFVAREVKREGWQYSGSEHELAQLRYLELVASMGGDAAFATAEGGL